MQDPKIVASCDCNTLQCTPPLTRPPSHTPAYHEAAVEAQAVDGHALLPQRLDTVLIRTEGVVDDMLNIRI